MFAAYAIIETYQKVIGRLGKYKMDLSKELLTPLKADSRLG